MTNFLIQGLPKIGKSLTVEKYIEENYNGGIYLGTLWRNDETNETITIHRNRRKHSFWQLFEVGSDLDNDIMIINNTYLNKYPGYAILFDSPTSMIFNYCYSMKNFEKIGNNIINQLITKLFYSENDIFIIDNLFDNSYSYFNEIKDFQKKYEKIYKNDFSSTLGR